jgi:hypothetical protein
MQRVTGAPEPPQPMSDEALGDLDRVIVAVTVARVTAQSYIPATT